MLSIPAFAQVEGITIFRDDVVFNQFYYLPRSPRLLLSDDGKPMFTFMRYQFPLVRTEGEPGGGYLVFTSTLKEDQQVIDQKLKPFLAAKLRAENPLAAQMPEPNISPVDFTDGTANLIIMKDNKMIKNVTLGRPSLMGDNTVSVAVELNSDAATLFYEALRRGGSIAAIEYNLRFPVRLPAVTILAHVDSKEVKSAVMTFTETKVTDGSVWGDDSHMERHRTSISESMESLGLIRLEILKGSVQLSQEDMESLRSFAFRAMDEFIKKHLLAGGTIETAEDRKSQWMEFLKQDIKAAFDLNVSFRDVINREYNPSAQINPSFLKGKVEDLVMEIDLQNAPWFFNTLTVKLDTNLDFEAYGDIVHSVVGHISYDQAKADGTRIVKRESLTFTKGDRAAKQFQTRIAEVGKDKYHVDVEVNYKSGPRLQAAMASFDTTTRNLTLSVPNPGVVEVQFSASPKAFGDNMSAIEVEIEYSDPRNGVPSATETVILTADKPDQKYRRVIYAVWNRPFRYRATYVLTQGNQRSTTPWFEASSDTRFVTINTPFDQEFSLQVLASADWKEVQQIVVDLEYLDDKSDFRMAQNFSFQKDTPARQVWKFPIRDPKARSYKYTQTILYINGRVDPRPTVTRESDATVLVVGNAPGGVATVEVDAADTRLGVDVVRVIARLTYSDLDNDVLDTETLVFRNGTEMKEWQIARADAKKVKYLFDVEYFMKDGSRRKLHDQTGLVTSIRDVLPLPAPPAA
ncbi:MAG: hypothetical protein IT168_19670 [Bryobacterales bacterium]|nr:hypothetical protein [Bryobacterales bacterium]